MFLDFQEHLHNRDVRVLEYSYKHINEVRTKYYDDDQWHMFSLDKKTVKFFLFLHIPLTGVSFNHLNQKLMILRR